MNINQSVTYEFEFSDIAKDVPHPVTKGERIAIIKSARLSWTDYNKPQESLDGDSYYFDYEFRGSKCKANGTIDKRSVAGPIIFKRHVHALEFMIALMKATEEIEGADTVTDNILRYLKDNLERAVAREREELARLLS